MGRKGCLRTSYYLVSLRAYVTCDHVKPVILRKVHGYRLVQFCGLEGADPRERILTEQRLALCFGALANLHTQHLTGCVIGWKWGIHAPVCPHPGPGGKINLW